MNGLSYLLTILNTKFSTTVTFKYKELTMLCFWLMKFWNWMTICITFTMENIFILLWKGWNFPYQNGSISTQKIVNFLCIMLGQKIKVKREDSQRTKKLPQFRQWISLHNLHLKNHQKLIKQSMKWRLSSPNLKKHLNLMIP